MNPQQDGHLEEIVRLVTDEQAEMLAEAIALADKSHKGLIVARNCLNDLKAALKLPYGAPAITEVNQGFRAVNRLIHLLKILGDDNALQARIKAKAQQTEAEGLND